ncbi:MAG: hypothetical protein AAFS03_07085, partial [Pseudomonadota bacterium]
MNKLARSILVTAAITVFASSIRAETQVEPPCPIEGFDECFRNKGEAFAREVEGRDQPDFFYRAYQQACDRLDADGCFILGSLLSEAEAVLQALPPGYVLPERTDRTAAIAALNESCSLGSAMGCATHSQILLSGLAMEYEDASIADRALIISGQKSACELGWLTACNVYLDLSRFIDPEEWPEGALQFAMTEQDVASKLCADDDLD